MKLKAPYFYYIYIYFTYIVDCEADMQTFQVASCIFGFKLPNKYFFIDDVK